MTTTADRPILAELSDNGERVHITFKYAPDRVVKVKKVPTARPWKKGEKFLGWALDRDLPTMRKLREQFGDDLAIGPKLKKWGQDEVAKETKLVSMSQADDADLESKELARLVKGVDPTTAKLLPKKPKKGQPVYRLREYQKADIKFMSETNAINANQPGAGKTVETIGAIIEAGLAWGQHLVFAPKTSLRTVWEDELKNIYRLAGLDAPVVLTGDDPAARREALAEAKALADDGCAFWLVLNPAMGRMKRVRVGEGDAMKFEEELANPFLAEIDWDSMTIDEFHLMGLSNPATQGSKGMNYIAEVAQPGKKFALSGTPMGGKPIKLWGALHFLNPEEFSSRWNWARHWLVINKSQYGSAIEGIMPGREVDFYNHLKPYLVRRTKREALPGLPPKNRIPVKCGMTIEQRDQYHHFATEAEWRIEDAEEAGRLTATNVLAEYMRLKQFASAYCDVVRTGREKADGMPEIKVNPVAANSGKVEQLVEKLREENVIVAKSKDEDDPKCALVFSQFNEFVGSIARFLAKEHDVPVATLTGATKDGLRTALKNSFQEQSVKPLVDYAESGKVRKVPEEIQNLIDRGVAPRVLVMNTLAGGAAITLTQADSVHLMDETWVPDNQEQAEDRAHRGDDKTMAKDDVRIYYYRTRNSIEEYIEKLVADKQLNNRTVLDLRRRMQKDLEAAEAAEAA